MMWARRRPRAADYSLRRWPLPFQVSRWPTRRRSRIRASAINSFSACANSRTSSIRERKDLLLRAVVAIHFRPGTVGIEVTRLDVAEIFAAHRCVIAAVALRLDAFALHPLILIVR